MASVLTRFAPSPTGYLHVGNMRTALICWLFSRSQGGEFMLRLDDTDRDRSEERYAKGVEEDLRWMGLTWDRFAKQSERMMRYTETLQMLAAKGRAYLCYETAEELEIKRKIQLGRGLPPIYDRAALRLTEDDKKRFESEMRVPHWRFKLDETAVIRWHDLVKGPMEFEAKYLSDPIIFRETGLPTYLLPSAVDDVDFGVTHIVRGEDHVTNTAIHVQMFEAMGAPIPQFAHLALIKSKEGKISKREGGFDVRSLREKGIEPMAIASFLARIGTSLPVVPETRLEDLVRSFDFSVFSRSSATYDIGDIDQLNPKVLQKLSYEEVNNRLTSSGLSGIDEVFWNVVRSNLNHFHELAEWWRICKETLVPMRDDADKEFLQEAALCLPPEPWDVSTWLQWLGRLKEQTDRKGKGLFMPLRKALTAAEHGPELQAMLPLIGYARVRARLLGEAA